MEEARSTNSLPVVKGIDDLIIICKELSGTVDVSAAVVAEAIVGCGVGMTVFSIVAEIGKLTEPRAVVAGMFVSVSESRDMLPVVKGVWAKVSETIGVATGGNVSSVGMGVALLMEEVRFTMSKVSVAIDIDNVGLGNAVVSAKAKLAVVRNEGSIVMLITDGICSML